MNCSNFFSVLPPNLKRVTILFPDPWYNEKKNRRVVNEKLVIDIFKNLLPGGEVLLVSDIKELAEYMVEHFMVIYIYIFPLILEPHIMFIFIIIILFITYVFLVYLYV